MDVGRPPAVPPTRERRCGSHLLPPVCLPGARVGRSALLLWGCGWKERYVDAKKALLIALGILGLILIGYL